MTNIVAALRTPLARGKKDGAFSDIHPVDLVGILVREIITKHNCEPSIIEDLILGCATATGEQGGNIARNVTRKFLGDSIPGVQVNRWCGSSAEAVDIAACKLMAKRHDLVLAGGVESMSRVPMGSDMLPFPGEPSNVLKIFTQGKKVIHTTFPENVELVPMGKSGELIAEKYELTRRELDGFSYQSHKKAAHATKEGYFEKEIVPVKTQNGLIKHDEGIRANTSIERMGTLKSSFKVNGVVTAANSSQITDGAAMLLMASDEGCKKYGFKSKTKIIASHVVGVDPVLQLLGPIKVIPKVLEKAKLKMSDIDLFEVNEAFASVVLAVQKDLNIPLDKLNVNGGAIALGHPLGCSGARLLVTLLHEMERRNLKYGLSALCIGGGQAIATIVERD